MKKSKKVKLIGSISKLENLLNSQMRVVKGGELGMPGECTTCDTCQECSTCKRRSS